MMKHVVIAAAALGLAVTSAAAGDTGCGAGHATTVTAQAPVSTPVATVAAPAQTPVPADQKVAEAPAPAPVKTN